VGADWLKGIPAAVTSPEPAVAVPVVPDSILDEAVTFALLLSIIWSTVKEVMPPLPLCVANVIAAIGPLPENGSTRTMAILILPGTEVLAPETAPEIRLPQLTDGDDNADGSYPTVSVKPDTPSMLLPRSTKAPFPEGVIVTEAPRATEALHTKSSATISMNLVWSIMGYLLIAGYMALRYSLP